MELGGQHDVVAPAAQRLADDLLVLAGAVHVGGVDEVDAGVERAVDDPRALVAVAVAPHAEHHRAEPEAADPDAGRAERSRYSALHHVSPRTNGWARARGWRTRGGEQQHHGEGDDVRRGVEDERVDLVALHRDGDRQRLDEPEQDAADDRAAQRPAAEDHGGDGDEARGR